MNFHLKNSSFEKYGFWFSEKFISHKNSPKFLKFVLEFFTQVCISMYDDKTIFVNFQKIYGNFYNNKNQVFQVLKSLFWLLPVDRTGRPSQESVDRVGRPMCTERARHVCWRAGRPTRSTARELLLSGKPRSTGPVDRQRALLSVPGCRLQRSVF